MCTRWIAIIALLAVVVVATGCAAMEDEEDEEFMSPPPSATALVITGSQAPTSTPSMSESTDAPIRYQDAAVVAELAEPLRHSYRAREGNLSEVETHAHRLRRLLPDDTDVAECADLALTVARIQQMDAGS